MPEQTPASANDPLIAQLDQIAEGLAQTFAPFCEVVVLSLIHI